MSTIKRPAVPRPSPLIDGKRLLIAGVALASSLAPSIARADETVSVSVPSTEQIIFDDEAAMKRWYYGWTIGFAAATAGYLTVGTLVHSTSVRQESYLTAVSTGIGLLATVIPNTTLVLAPGDLRDMPTGTDEERAARKQRADYHYSRAVARERFTRSWLARIGGLALNLATASVRLFVFKHPIPAAYNAVASLVVGEARVWTMPDRAMRAGLPTVSVMPLMDRTTAGLALVGSW